MKTLSLFRHAKASWKFPVDDVHRPLSGRGLNQLSYMAQNCSLSSPELILSSPASRAYATALSYLYERDIPLSRLQLNWDLYEANGKPLLESLLVLSDQISNLWLVGHNPGLNLLADYLLDESIKNIPTSAFVSMTINVQNWAELTSGSASLVCFEKPASRHL